MDTDSATSPPGSHAFLGRQPITGRDGELIGFELLYRARATDDRACFEDEDSASLQVLSTLLHELGAAQVLAERQAFVNVGPRSLSDAGALVLLNPRRTVLELSRTIVPDAATLARVRMLRDMGFGVAVSVEPPTESFSAWLPVATHLKVDLRRVPDAALDVFVSTLRWGDHVLVAEKVETAAQARRCVELGFHAMQGWYVGRPEVMGSVRPGVSHAVVRRALSRLAEGAAPRDLESTVRLDTALCWRLLRYTAASNFGMMIPVESLGHALELVGSRRLGRWLQLLLNTVEEPSPAAATLLRTAAWRGRMLEMVGAEYFSGVDCDNLFLVGAFSMLPAMLMQPMNRAITSLALPEAVADALTMRQGRYGPLLDLVEALESGPPERVEALCENLTLSSRTLLRARQSAHAAVREAAFA
jgi:EAL and modified HD-GYP domain-containing signal transduction protein